MDVTQASTHPACGVLLQAACQRVEQGGLAGARRAEQQGEASGVQDATHIVQDRKSRFVGLPEVHLLQVTLQKQGSNGER